MSFNLPNLVFFLVICSIVLVVSAGKYSENAQQRTDRGPPPQRPERGQPPHQRPERGQPPHQRPERGQPPYQRPEGGQFPSQLPPRPGPDQEWKFRQRRTNQVWEKAQRNGMNPKRLEALEKELQSYDERAMLWKKYQRDGGDPEGEKEARLRRDLADIMKRYGIGRDGGMAEERMAGGRRRDGLLFEDMRLNKLWAKTIETGQFSEEELNDLREEFDHHQEKVGEYRLLMNDLHGRDEDFNRVDKFKRLDVNEAMEAKDRKLQELELKMKHKTLNDDYQRLEIKALPDEERSEFVEPRLHKMYKEALTANFTDDELQSLKEELKHFEKKLSKHESVKHEALKAEMEFLHSRAAGEKPDPSRHQSLKEKAKEMAQTVKKYMTDFTDRISSRQHNEL